MGWNSKGVLALKKEFVEQAKQPGVNLSELCRRYQVSRKTGYKWLNRQASEGDSGLVERSRRPKAHPHATSPDQTALIIDAAHQKPYWGAHKLYYWLKQQGVENLPSQTTCHRILSRAGLTQTGVAPTHWKRFEHEQPNDLWQMDFKGHFALDQGRCHPLTLLDDHSRFSLGIKGCADERTDTVQDHLVAIFRRYGLPVRINVDNGSPWGRREGPCSRLGVFLIRLGIALSYSQPYHPQTNGKLERFHRTLKAEVLRYQHYRDLNEVNQRFEAWRDEYNLERPHQALGMNTPVSRYRASERGFPERLPPIIYDSPDDHVRKVCYRGFVKFKSHQVRVGEALQDQYVAIRPLDTDDLFGVYYCHQCLFKFNLKDHKKLKRWQP